MGFLKNSLPEWLRGYRREWWHDDLLAGCITTILVLPQSLAYALLAGLPPQAGLCASVLPVIAYALWGSSRVQAVGPVAITAIMTYATLAPLATPGSPQYLQLATLLALLSGLLLLACGFLRLGFLAQLLSRPVINGFLSGSAVLIIFSQIRYLLGLHPSGNRPGEILQAIGKLDGHASTAALGIASFIFLVFSRRWLSPLLQKLGMQPQGATFLVRLSPLLAVLAALLTVVHFNLDQYGVAVVGSIDTASAVSAVHLPETTQIGQLFIPALLVALIGMVQNISMGQALAIKRRERLDANKELVGLGAANFVAAFSCGMPVGGGVSRSVINVDAGARSPLASIVSAIAMLTVIASLAPLFTRMPLAALAASIIVAATTLIDVQALRQAWHYDRADALALLGTASGVILLGLESGIGLGILLSLATLLLRASTPHIAVIGRIPGSEHFRNVERHGVETLPDTVFLRIDESLFFGNLAAVEARLAHELNAAPQTRNVVLIMSAVNRIDTTAMEVLSDLNRDLSERDIRLHFAEIKGPVQDRLCRTPLWQNLSGKVFFAVNDAFEHLSRQ